jgi:GR25 family glycosyltransferase involved in LPS biosynthesis
MNHFLAIEDAYRKSYSSVLILRDDLDLTVHFQQFVSIAVKSLPINWDYFSLYVRPENPLYDRNAPNPFLFPAEPIALPIPLYKIIIGKRLFMNDYARAFSRVGMKEFLEAAKVSNIAVDVMEGDLIEQGKLNAFVYAEPIVSKSS